MNQKELLQHLAKAVAKAPEDGIRVSVPFLEIEKIVSYLPTVLSCLNKTPLHLTIQGSDMERSIVLHPMAVDLISPEDFKISGHIDHLGAVGSVNLSTVTVAPAPLTGVPFKKSNPEDLSKDLQRGISSTQTKTLPKGLNMAKISMRQFWEDFSVYLKSQKRPYSIGVRDTYYTQIVQPKFKKKLKSEHPGLKIFIELSYKLDDANSGTAYLKLILQGKDIDFNTVLKVLEPTIDKLPNHIRDFSVGEQRNTTLLAKQKFSQLGDDLLVNGKDFSRISEVRACFDWYMEQLDLLITDIFSDHLTAK